MLAQDQQTAITQKLVAWAAILAVPAAVAGIYGMNFEHMPELHGKYSYYILIGTVVVVCVVLYRYLKKVRWL